MSLKRRTPAAALAVVIAAVFAVAALLPAVAAAKTLSGTVGPGFTISLKSGGKKVKSVKAGRYTIRVSDKSNIHNFHLRGPGVNKVITSVGFKGTKSTSVKLKKGTYRYVCDPHSSEMKGSFKVR
jgi:plastocyanin